MKINPDSPRHPYVQLADQLRAGIKAGKIGPRLPSLMEISTQSGASVATVQRAFGLLADEGLIYTVQGRGTFVTGSE